MLGRTLLRLSSVDPGVDIQNVLITRVALSPSALLSPANIRAAWQDILNRVRHVPGVQSVAAPPASQMPLSLLTSVTPDYLTAMGIPLRQGRFFKEHDRIGNELVVVIDEVMAQRAFCGRDPTGNRLWFQFIGPARVVGVVGHVRHWGLDSDDQAIVREQIYFPFTQAPNEFLCLASSAMYLAIRATGPPLNVVEALRREVRGTTQDQALYKVHTMEEIVSGTLARQRFLLLFGIFGGLALLLACIGIYGVLAYLTSQRVPEFGVRMAPWSERWRHRASGTSAELGMIVVGVVLGIARALAAGRLVGRLVAGVRPTEPLTFAVMISMLVVAAWFASFVPARRVQPRRPDERSTPGVSHVLMCTEPRPRSSGSDHSCHFAAAWWS